VCFQSELEQYTEKLNALTEGSLEQLSANRLLVLDWTRALTRFMQVRPGNSKYNRVRVEQMRCDRALTCLLLLVLL
jgi:hypothetical protein